MRRGVWPYNSTRRTANLSVRVQSASDPVSAVPISVRRSSSEMNSRASRLGDIGIATGLEYLLRTAHTRNLRKGARWLR